MRWSLETPPSLPDLWIYLWQAFVLAFRWNMGKRSLMNISGKITNFDNECKPFLKKRKQLCCNVPLSGWFINIMCCFCNLYPFRLTKLTRARPPCNLLFLCPAPVCALISVLNFREHLLGSSALVKICCAFRNRTWITQELLLVCQYGKKKSFGSSFYWHS